MLEQINTMVMSQCDEKGLRYECKVIGAISDYYIGDVMKLKQVLINILSNAIKFTEAPGSVLMTVERTAVFRDHSSVKFCIKDTGIGIDQAFLPKIFDTFTQEDSGRSNKYGSTGLGMAITKNIVELMNGTISVKSKKGVGTEFTVVITLTNSDHQNIKPADDRENKPGDIHIEAVEAETTINTCGDGQISLCMVKEEKRAELKGRHILMAEDVLINAEIMKQIILVREAFIDHAENGKIVLEMFENSPVGYYDAILMDVRMPEMDGLEATSAIRSLSRPDAKTIPIIALTANAFDEDVQRSLQAGMNAHLSKPVEPERLYQTLEELISERELTSTT
jgi:CheY-like chemotaxis protein